MSSVWRSNTSSGRRPASRRWPSDPTTAWRNRRDDIAAAIGRVNAGRRRHHPHRHVRRNALELAISLLEIGKVEVVAGLNLPMLVKLARVRKDYALGQGGHGGAGRGAQVHQRRASQILGD